STSRSARGRWTPAMRATSTSKGKRAMRMLWVVEATVLLAAFAAAVWLRYFNDPEARVYFMSVAPQRALMVPLFLTGAMMAFGLYPAHGRLTRIDVLQGVALSFAFGGVALLVLFHLIRVPHIGRDVLGLTLLIGAAGVLLVRLAAVPLFAAE